MCEKKETTNETQQGIQTLRNLSIQCVQVGKKKNNTVDFGKEYHLTKSVSEKYRSKAKQKRTRNFCLPRIMLQSK